MHKNSVEFQSDQRNYILTQKEMKIPNLTPNDLEDDLGDDLESDGCATCLIYHDEQHPEEGKQERELKLKYCVLIKGGVAESAKVKPTHKILDYRKGLQIVKGEKTTVITDTYCTLLDYVSHELPALFNDVGNRCYKGQLRSSSRSKSN